VAGFRQGLSEAGYVDGRNVTIEFRWAEDRSDRFSALAADLVGRQVTVIVTSAGTALALAAKAATPTIPIVFVMGADPVKFGLVASLGRPGGNLTGVSFLFNVLVSKRLQLLHELAPTARVIGVLVNPNNPNAVSDTKDVEAAARALRLQTHVVTARTRRDLDTAFASLVEQRVGALLVAPDLFFVGARDRLTDLAARQALPTIYDRREQVSAGGLISYGTDMTDAHRHAGIYAGRILKGAKPADLPVLQPTKFELIINLKTAKALGLTIPPSLLARADHVLE
jgi:putative ABC transport system substrate-binding protein